MNFQSLIFCRVIVSMSEVPLASGLADEDTTYGLLFPRETETFGSVDVVPGTVKLHPGFSVRKFELRTRRYGRRIGTAGGFSGGSPAAGGSGRNSGPRIVFLVSLLETPRHPRSELDLLRCVRVAANIRKSEAYKTLVLPG
jgi:hypothetical protein